MDVQDISDMVNAIYKFDQLILQPRLAQMTGPEMEQHKAQMLSNSIEDFYEQWPNIVDAAYYLAGEWDALQLILAGFMHDEVGGDDVTTVIMVLATSITVKARRLYELFVPGYVDEVKMLEGWIDYGGEGEL